MKIRTYLTTAILFFSLAAVAQTEQLGTFRCAALNVDGLPAKLSVAGIEISLNPDSKGGDGAYAIGKKAVEKEWDFFAVSEDFNFNDELMAPLTEAGYSAGTYRGNISVTAGAVLNFTQQKPVTNTDGLNLIWNKDMTVGNEYFNKWNDHYGYTEDGADGLINKGYRFYTVEVAKDIVIDLYILHMDAEVSEGDLAARESQLNQLVADIVSLTDKRPKIVMGDTNCRYTRDRLKDLFLTAINADERYTINDCWVEKYRRGLPPVYGANALMVDKMGYKYGEIVDKMFYINHKDSPYKLTLNDFYVDTEFNNEAGEPLADHYPVVGEFGYYIDESIDPIISWDIEELNTDGSTQYYLFNKGSEMFLCDDNTLSEKPTVSWSIDGTDIKSANDKHISITSSGYSKYTTIVTANATQGATSSLEKNEGSSSYRIGNKIQVGLTSSRTRFLSYRNGSLTYAEKNNDNTIEEGAQWIFVSEEQYNKKTQKPEEKIPGDVDSDGSVTMNDANMIVNHFLGNKTDSFNEKNADVDGDEAISMSDANAVVNIYLSK